MSRPLSGIKHERGATFYIENIEICDREQDKDIKRQVISQAKANNIRIMQCYVIHNRVSEYRVGCKIVVPQSAAEMITQPHVWPDPVRCREWVQRGRYTRSRQHDDLDYDDIHQSSTEYSASNYREWHDNMYQNEYVE
ncbi:unnamed protein product [Owenia fusiformis]|uniref:Uncharacterized protein n=1 Tax=Owenia fusiformis TaxID=6347 RepID=A0A8S4NC73_OWEFU|nr:unnamed protein product [Owenia fusiformis]